MGELKQAKEAHSPELKHFCSLEKKILNMELRHQQREKELQQVEKNTKIGTSYLSQHSSNTDEKLEMKRLKQIRSIYNRKCVQSSKGQFIIHHQSAALQRLPVAYMYLCKNVTAHRDARLH